jgi:hypothetical protein
MKRPENPDLEDLMDFDTKVLSDVKQLLNDGNLSEAAQFIENNAHQKLW